MNRLRHRYGHLKRPAVFVTVRDTVGTVLHQETRAAFNAGIRASEDAVRTIARAEQTHYEGDRPNRAGDTYTRRWVGRNGKTVVATITKDTPQYGHAHAPGALEEGTRVVVQSGPWARSHGTIKMYQSAQTIWVRIDPEYVPGGNRYGTGTTLSFTADQLHAEGVA